MVVTLIRLSHPFFSLKRAGFGYFHYRASLVDQAAFDIIQKYTRQKVSGDGCFPVS